MKNLEFFLVNLSNLIWGEWLVYLLFFTGIFLTFSLKFIQITKFHLSIKQLFKKSDSKDKNGNISSFQALATAMGSCVGNGNIIGVATALTAGGPGALFWMWIAGIFGMATKYCEIVLGVHFRHKTLSSKYLGGPMYYISKGLNMKKLGFLYAFLLFFQNAGGTLIQSNAIKEVIVNLFSLNKFIASLLLIVTTLLIITGGIKRLGKISQFLVPFMTFFYIIGGILVIIYHKNIFADTLSLIFKSAFSPTAGAGGFAGYSIKSAMRYGIARGLYSNEAGEGTAAVIHAAAIVDHPVKQGLLGFIEVAVDTIIICSITGLVILTSGVNFLEISPAIMVSIAFAKIHWSFKYIVGISMLLFGFSSIIAQWYFGNTTLNYLTNEKTGELYKYLFLALVTLGPFLSLNLVWYIQDIFLGLLIIPNIFSLFMLSPLIKNLTFNFFKQRSI